MPKPVEDALRKAAKKLAQKGKLHRQKGDSLRVATDKFVFGTMTRMYKEGKIPAWGHFKK